MRVAAAQVACKCKASLFAYPPPVTQEAAAAAAKVPTAVLSTTARARDKAKKKEKKKAEAAADAPAGAPGVPRRSAHARAVLAWAGAASAASLGLPLAKGVAVGVVGALSQLVRDSAASNVLSLHAPAADAAPCTCVLCASSLRRVPLQAAGCPSALEVSRAVRSSACCLRVWFCRRTAGERLQ